MTNILTVYNLTANWFEVVQLKMVRNCINLIQTSKKIVNTFDQSFFCLLNVSLTAFKPDYCGTRRRS